MPSSPLDQSQRSSATLLINANSKTHGLSHITRQPPRINGQWGSLKRRHWGIKGCNFLVSFSNTSDLRKLLQLPTYDHARAYIKRTPKQPPNIPICPALQWNVWRRAATPGPWLHRDSARIISVCSSCHFILLGSRWWFSHIPIQRNPPTKLAEILSTMPGRPWLSIVAREFEILYYRQLQNVLELELRWSLKVE